MKKAFTLIELLVVIALIAIIVAMLFPAIATVEERANRAKCLSNLKQIAAGAVQQFGDLGDELPTRPEWADFGAAAEGVMPYVKYVKEVFDCPSNPGNENTAQRTYTMPNYDNYRCDYEFNGYLCNIPGHSIVRRQNMITDYSTAAYVMDTPYWDDALMPHEGGSNVGYLDGHARWVPKEDLGLGLGPGGDAQFIFDGHDVYDIEQASGGGG